MGKYDTAWKTYFSDEHRFADLINGVIGGGAQLVSAQQLSDLDSQVGYRTPDQAAPADPASPFKNEQRKWKKMRPKFRDMVRKVALGMNFVIVGIESQEKTHYLMPLRCMGYDVREYERQAAMEASRVKQAYEKKEISLREEEYLSLFRKDSRLMPCITLVLYFGDEWDGATSLRELLEERDVPDAFLPFINNYHVHILHVKKMQSTDMFHTDLKLLFDSVRFSNHKNEFRKYVTENPAFSRVRKDTYELMLQYADLKEVGAFLQGAKTEGNKETVREKGEINMCQAMRELMEDSKKEGLSQGLSQGISQGLSQGIQVLIKKEKSWNMSREAILADIMQEFKISREEAEASMAEYDRRE